MRCSFSVLAILVLLPFAAFSQDRSGDVIKQLRKKKVATLREVHKRTTDAYNTGKSNIHDLAQSAMAVQEGILEAAETKEERLAARTEMVKTAEELVKTAESLYAANKLSVLEVLQARVALIDRKIAMDKEKATQR